MRASFRYSDDYRDIINRLDKAEKRLEDSESQLYIYEHPEEIENTILSPAQKKMLYNIWQFVNKNKSTSAALKKKGLIYKDGPWWKITDKGKAWMFIDKRNNKDR